MTSGFILDVYKCERLQAVLDTVDDIQLDPADPTLILGLEDLLEPIDDYLGGI